MKQRNLGSKATKPRSGPQVQALLDRYVALMERADIAGFVALLREDAWFTMPPFPVWVQGRAAIATFFQTPIFAQVRRRRMLPTRANGSPAFGLYQWEAQTGVYQLFGLAVLGVVDDQIAQIVAFLDRESLSPFALPTTVSQK
jgi:RNA polymerase sigma-70 factor (ECF subfamily)